VRSSPRYTSNAPCSKAHRPRPKERGQPRRGSTDCTAANAKLQADRRAAHRACRLRSARTRNTTGKNGRSVRTGERSPLDSRVTAERRLAEGAPAGHGRTVQSRRTLIPVNVPATVLTQQARKCAVEIHSQRRGSGRCWVRSNHHSRPRGQRVESRTREVPQLPLHPIADDRVANCLRDDETHSSRCPGSGTTQVDDERSATGATSPTHSGCEVTAVAHSVSG